MLFSNLNIYGADLNTIRLKINSNNKEIKAPIPKSGPQTTMVKKITVKKEASQFGILLLFSHSYMGYRTIEKDNPSTNTTQKGRKIKNVKIKVVSNSPKKK